MSCEEFKNVVFNFRYLPYVFVDINGSIWSKDGDLMPFFNIISNGKIRDEFQLEFSGSSRAMKVPSRAGALQFPS
jgi:hypothetical protein